MVRSNNCFYYQQGIGSNVSTFSYFFVYYVVELVMKHVDGSGIMGSLYSRYAREIYYKTMSQSIRYVTIVLEKVSFSEELFPCIWLIGS